MEIKLKSLWLVNFKKAQNLKVEFNQDGPTNITGDNGTGKTTIFDAMLWLLFGKDSTDRKEFEIQTLDADNKVIHRLDHEVTGEFIVDSETVVIKRVMREDWVKRKGAEHEELKGATTTYFYNEVPMKKVEFDAKINLLINDSVFKLITSPLAFNALTWQKRREVLIELAGGFDLNALLDKVEGAREFEKQLATDKGIEELKKMLAARIKKAKDEKDQIPARIDEANRSKPAVPEQGFAAIREVVDLKQNEVKNIEAQLDDRSKITDEKLKHLNEKKVELNGYKTNLQNLYAQARKTAKSQLAVGNEHTEKLEKLNQDLNSKAGTLKSYQSTESTIKSRIESNDAQLKSVEKKMLDKRNEWTKTNAEEVKFNDNEFCCPTCKREFEADQVESKRSELLENFNKTKKDKLDAINSQGKALASEKNTLLHEADELKQQLEANGSTVKLIEDAIQGIRAEMATTEMAAQQFKEKAPSEEDLYQAAIDAEKEADLKQTIERFEEGIATAEAELKATPEIEGMRARRDELKKEIDLALRELQKEEEIKRVTDRVSQLEAEEKTLSQAIMEAERAQFVVAKFNKEKINTIEAGINDKFQLVKFKMFEQLFNGGEQETCVCLINGVPFQDANTASKINAGVDIINALCKHYGVTAPIFIDNRESVINLIDSPSQIVNLKAKEGVKTLEIA